VKENALEIQQSAIHTFNTTSKPPLNRTDTPHLQGGSSQTALRAGNGAAGKGNEVAPSSLISNLDKLCLCLPYSTCDIFLPSRIRWTGIGWMAETRSILRLCNMPAPQLLQYFEVEVQRHTLKNRTARLRVQDEGCRGSFQRQRQRRRGCIQRGGTHQHD
jgi:hypothetical protein